MKKFLFIVAVMAIAMASCKKGDKTDPEPTNPTDPPAVNDSMDVNLRVYATSSQMNYLNYQFYITYPGETKEEKYDMTNPQALSKTYDGAVLAFTEDYGEDVYVYTLDKRVKKGKASFRFEYSKADSMPEELNLVLGLVVYKKDVIVAKEVSGYKGIPSDTIDTFMNVVLKKYPKTINIE